MRQNKNCFSHTCLKNYYEFSKTIPFNIIYKITYYFKLFLNLKLIYFSILSHHVPEKFMEMYKTKDLKLYSHRVYTYKISKHI